MVELQLLCCARPAEICLIRPMDIDRTGDVWIHRTESHTNTDRDKSEHLLEEAREFCDPVTGEVINRIPDELMSRLREAKLARGIHGVPSKHTVAGATWFVFLNAEIRDRVLAERRVQAASRKRRSQAGEQSGPTHSLPGTPAASGIPSQRGLKAFRQRRTPNGGE